MLVLLQEIDDICSRNGITYYLGGGTALGAIRHQGFLPWDDDADLYITRENWQKLLSVIDGELKSGRDLICIERYSDYGNPIARYMNLDSTWIYQSQMFSGVPAGQHIEFLILDPLPVDEVKAKDYIELFQVYNEIMGVYFVVNRVTSLKNDIFNLELYHYWLNRANELGLGVVLREMEDLLYSYPEEECEKYHLRHGFEYHVYTKKNFGKQRYVPFETTMLPVAEHAEAVFREAYGDSWKRVPPKDEQVLHKSMSSLDVPYSEYWNRAFKYVSQEDSRDIQLAWKQSAVELIPEKNQVELDYRHMQTAMDACDFEYRFGDANSGYGQDDFEDYYRKQMNQYAVRESRVFSVSVSFAEAAIRYWLKLGQYWKSCKLLKLFERADKYIALRERYLSICEQSRQIDSYLDLGDLDSAISVCESSSESSEGLSPLYGHARLLQEKKQSGVNTGSYREMSESLMGAFPQYSFFVLSFAEGIASTHRAKAVELLRGLIGDSLDGLVVVQAKAMLTELEG